MPTASPAPDAPLPLDAAWSTIPGRKAAVRTFIARYRTARDRRDAPLHDSPDGHVVRFDAGMGRPFEHFMIEARRRMTTARSPSARGSRAAAPRVSRFVSFR
ncbi:hypothetical protein [Burkholderia lata]|uniref:hypothetical protein n=1 Tax=Burkholderia lata (strain ATCC 17760 / DSM 23089 / LMG 22485 / NCIMB 9086 / R18194 / 383) TaxID=482957 RepID=UPI0020C67792|nr:hypothetical protein [Burkholderia lata]